MFEPICMDLARYHADLYVVISSSSPVGQSIASDDIMCPRRYLFYKKGSPQYVMLNCEHTMALLQFLSLSELSLLAFLLLLLPLYVLHRRSAASKQLEAPLPPTPPGVPILGNLHQIGSLPHRSLRDLSDKHGPLMLLHLGRVPTLIVSSADTAREIMKTHDQVFASRPPFKVAHTVLYGTTDMAFAPYGEYWRNVRKLCVNHLLSSKMVHSFHRIREEEVAIMIEKISSQSSPSVVNLSEVLLTFANDILCRTVSGKLSLHGRRSNVFRELIEEVSAIFGAFNFTDFFPYLGWVDLFIGLNSRAQRHSKMWDDVLEEVIKCHANRTPGDEFDDVDFVDILLSLQKDFQLTKGNIKALLVDMFFAGTDTSYIVLEWAMAELVQNCEAMKNLQDEVRGIVGGKSKIREEDLNQMCYLKCVIKEILRLHPPAALLLHRESMEECEIQGYKIPNKARVIINAWAISRDPRFWEEPESFRPERFIGSPIDFRGNDFQFIPFGAGRRICPGMNFAMASIELALANLINQFDWELPDGMPRENFDMTECPGLTIHRKLKLDLIAKPYIFISED